MTSKRSTLQTILIGAHNISLTEELLKNELKKEFIKVNGYPNRVFDQVNKEWRLPRNADYDNNVTTNIASITTTHRLIIFYKGKQWQKIIKSVNNYVKRLLL